MDQIKFGPSGNSMSFYDSGHKGTEEAAEYTAKMGLNAYEYSFGRGILLGDEKAKKIGDAFQVFGVEFSVHAPYFINLANIEGDKIENSYRYILDSAAKLKLIGGKRVIFHPASCGKMKREDAVKLTIDRFQELNSRIEAAGFGDVTFCPETMGKHGQIGTTAEVVEMCKVHERFIPCIDFGHVNAFGLGCLKTKDDFRREVDIVFEGLGDRRAKNIHIHFSKIMYSAKGEVKHLTLADNVYGPEFEPLAEILHEYRMTPVVISESDGVQAEDALKLKKIYEGGNCL